MTIRVNVFSTKQMRAINAITKTLTGKWFNEFRRVEIIKNNEIELNVKTNSVEKNDMNEISFEEAKLIMDSVFTKNFKVEKDIIKMYI